MLAARQDIKTQQANHLPTVNANAQYITGKSPTTNFTGIDNIRTTNYIVGINVDLPVVQGGLILSQVRAATARFKQAIARLQQVDRQLLSNTHNAYTGIVLGVNEVRTGRQAVIDPRR